MPETKFTTSFIPKKPAQVPVGNMGYKRSGGSGIFSFISIIIFILVLAGVGGMYFWKKELDKKVDSQIESLKKTVENFDKNFVNEAVKLSTRIDVTKQLLENHISISNFFELLEKNTLPSVSFNNLTYNYGTEKDNRILIKANGLGSGFESIVLQSDQYGITNSLKDVIFSGLQQNKEGFVTFTFESSLDSELIRYNNSFNKSNLEN